VGQPRGVFFLLKNLPFPHSNKRYKLQRSPRDMSLGGGLGLRDADAWGLSMRARVNTWEPRSDRGSLVRTWEPKSTHWEPQSDQGSTGQLVGARVYT
jgi:hypothetical protein